MRFFAAYFVLLYLFHYEIYAVSRKISELRSWFANNVRGRQDTTTTDTLKKLCIIEVKKGSKHQINVGNIDITNKNTLENFINLPSIKMPDITIVLAENNSPIKARTANHYKEEEMDKLIEQFKKCMIKKLKIFS
ncbi:uncharacterized protein LOC108038232 [Drosophila rhopaloa]|uniref:Uncharacterized protein LOC108038232 n=1 Tax=Drosophila rhopaloa TaxID=1041015 RepID=A0A6P4DXP6_DRORH|nr:uncharacterized protein LOC108038232 [Drosophila rhopaloa]